MSKTLLKTVSLAAVAGILAFSPVQDAQAKKSKMENAGSICQYASSLGASRAKNC